MIKELLFRDNVMVKDYPNLGESVINIIYHQKGSHFAIENGIDEGGYCIHFASGAYHIISKNVVAVAIYE